MGKWLFLCFIVLLWVVSNAFVLHPSRKVGIEKLQITELSFPDDTKLTSVNDIEEIVKKRISELQASLPVPMRVNLSQNLRNGLTGWAVSWSHCKGVNSPRRVMSVASAVEWAKRSVEEQELLTAMGRAGTKYLIPFDVYAFQWTNASDGSCHVGPYHQTVVYPNTQLTFGSFCKLVSGSMRELDQPNISTGAVLGEWRLCGGHFNATYTWGYTHPVPLGLSESGEIWYALPAYVYGTVDLTDPLNWWHFPYASFDF